MEVDFRQDREASQGRWASLRTEGLLETFYWVELFALNQTNFLLQNS
jgi:hypothetical protein